MPRTIVDDRVAADVAARNAFRLSVQPTSTTPWSPSTSVRSPVTMTEVACSVPTTAGMPRSHDDAAVTHQLATVGDDCGHPQEQGCPHGVGGVGNEDVPVGERVQRVRDHHSTALHPPGGGADPPQDLLPRRVRGRRDRGRTGGHQFVMAPAKIDVRNRAIEQNRSQFVPGQQADVAGADAVAGPGLEHLERAPDLVHVPGDVALALFTTDRAVTGQPRRHRDSGPSPEAALPKRVAGGGTDSRATADRGVVGCAGSHSANQRSELGSLLCPHRCCRVELVHASVSEAGDEPVQRGVIEGAGRSEGLGEAEQRGLGSVASRSGRSAISPLARSGSSHRSCSRSRATFVIIRSAWCGSNTVAKSSRRSRSTRATSCSVLSESRRAPSRTVRRTSAR